MPNVLANIRVIDFTSGPVGGLATTVLADFGAEVIKVEPPAGDRFRKLASSPFWLRGKRSVVLDLETAADRDRAQTLAATADVVVVSGPPSRLRRWGIDGDTLSAADPRLVHCTITAWGTRGPYAELPGYEGLVAAKSGRMASFDVQLAQDRPVYAAVQVATHVASQAAVHGIVAALYRREASGLGDLVETSLVQALLPFDLVDVLSRQIAERDDRPFTALRKGTTMPTLNYHPVRTSDGRWIQCGNLLEHLFYSFLDAIDLLGEFLIDERFQGSPAVWTPKATEEARDRILTRVQERTCDEWMATFIANGNVAAEPIVTTVEALTHRDLVEGGELVEVHDPTHGETTQIGPIAELVATPAAVSGGAPLVGADTADVLAPAQEAAIAAADAVDRGVSDGATPGSGRPLDGVKILDLSTIIAAPLAMSMLADLGAAVVKVEAYGGDPFRQLLIEGRMAFKTNLGKTSICIDLKKPEGQAILHQLVTDADVVVHNFRGSVPAKLGLSYEQLRAINPGIIWAVVNGYGAHGPSAPRPATHPVMGAATGSVAFQAGEALTRDCPTLADVRENSRQIMAANDANPDPNTSVVAASAILLALLARERHPDGRSGGGQIVRVNMLTANAWANADDFLTYAGKAQRPTVDIGHHGLSACYRLYAASVGWVFVAATTDREFADLCRAAGLGDLADDPRFTTDEARRTNADELTIALAAHFVTKPASDWEAQLSARGVGCVRADSVEVDQFFLNDPHVLANGWSPIVEHARFGAVHRWGQVVTVGGPNPALRPAPLAGEHTDAILEELGHDAAAIAALRATKVVNSGPM